MDLERAALIAVVLMDKHLPKGVWKFEFSRTKRIFGQCSYKDKTIYLSKHLASINDESHVTDTILHEIAHALTPNHDHDKVWKDTCIKIGAKPERCYGAEVTPVKHNYVGTCPNGHQKFRYRLNARAHRISCGLCKDQYDPALKFTWNKLC